MSAATRPAAELRDLFLDVAEKAAFLLGFPGEKAEYAPPRSAWLRAEITVGGDAVGRLVLWVPAAAAAVMAADLLGEEPEEARAEALAADAVGELLNVVAGQAITALAGEQVSYRLSLPEVGPATEPAAREALAGDDCLLFSIDEEPYLLQVSLTVP